MNLKIKLVETSEEKEKAFSIREQVFIHEQHIDREDEYDQFEEASYHFLGLIDGEAVSTCRWRKTTEGIKLERFATLSQFRGKGVAGKLLQAAISHATDHFYPEKVKLYLNAQVTAIPLYAKFNFKEEGPRFLECDIEHQKMFREMD